jgi:hypothetical protein
MVLSVQGIVTDQLRECNPSEELVIKDFGKS